MSHVSTVDLEINDLQALRVAAEALGLQFNEGQTKYRWFGRSVGDYPVPEGFKASDLGKCEHAISVPGDNSAYEIGVVSRRDGKPGYQLVWDFWGPGQKITNVMGGKSGAKLKTEYGVAVATKQARREGWRVKREVNKEGQTRLRLHR